MKRPKYPSWTKDDYQDTIGAAFEEYSQEMSKYADQLEAQIADLKEALLEAIKDCKEDRDRECLEKFNGEVKDYCTPCKIDHTKKIIKAIEEKYS